ncbi:MAG: type III-A CRISPR-associated protein Csm2 [Bacteroidetes bacterium]|nr:type III-A CRISPR-associated protein Csm2 [Bacteroidota bacterium]
MSNDHGLNYEGRNHPSSNLKSDWIINGMQADKNILEWAKGFAYHLAITDEIKDLIERKNNKPVYRANLSTNQLRKFFGEMKRIQAMEFDKEGKWLSSFKMLKPKLAYAVGRERNKNPKIFDFYFELQHGIDAVTTKDHFNTFVQLVEAIVAYHKYFEKTEKIEEYEQD